MSRENATHARAFACHPAGVVACVAVIRSSLEESDGELSSLCRQARCSSDTSFALDGVTMPSADAEVFYRSGASLGGRHKLDDIDEPYGLGFA